MQIKKRPSDRAEKTAFFAIIVMLITLLVLVGLTGSANSAEPEAPQDPYVQVGPFGSMTVISPAHGPECIINLGQPHPVDPMIAKALIDLFKGADTVAEHIAKLEAGLGGEFDPQARAAIRQVLMDRCGIQDGRAV